MRSAVVFLVLVLFLATSRCATSTPEDAVAENATRKAGSLSRVLDFYNTELLRVNWGRVGENVTEGCREDVWKYIGGLEEAKSWALKSK